jgi:hypothetical protein
LVRDFPQCLWHETSADQLKLIETLELHAIETGKSDLLHLKAWVSCDKTKKGIQSNIKTVCCATALSLESNIDM